MLICDLIDAIKPGSIQYGLLKNSGTPEVCFEENMRETRSLLVTNNFSCLLGIV